MVKTDDGFHIRVKARAFEGGGVAGCALDEQHAKEARKVTKKSKKVKESSLC